MRDISRYLRPNKGGRGGEGLQQKLCNIKTIWNHTRNPQQENIIKSSPYHAVKECLTRDIQFMAQKKKKISKFLSDYKKEKETMAAAV